MSIPSDLIAAYRAALYDIDAGHGNWVTLRIGHSSTPCDEILRVHRAMTAAVITAYNPRSRKRSAVENASAHRALNEAVTRMGKTALPSRARAPDGSWPVEPGLFVLEIAGIEALALAQRFDQFAFVWIERGGPATLVFAT